MSGHFFIALLLVCCSASTCTGTRANSYALVDTASASFELCLGAEPSNELRASLLMCRELSYAYCINSSLVASVLTLDANTSAQLAASRDEPSVRNVERLTWLVDSSLVVLYELFSGQSYASPRCAYAWHGWLCSRVFRRASGSLSVDVCAQVCSDAERACSAKLQCDTTRLGADCTNYYVDSTSCSAAARDPTHVHGRPRLAAKQQLAAPVVYARDAWRSHVSAATGMRTTCTHVLVCLLLLLLHVQIVRR